MVQTRPELRVVHLSADPAPGDCRQAMKLAEAAAGQQLGEAMLLSCCDRDRDFESPQHTSECRRDSAVPGYVDYRVSHRATHKLGIEDGRFVLCFRAWDLPPGICWSRLPAAVVGCLSW